VDVRPQATGSFGDRLAHAFARHFADGAQRAVIIGSDTPGVDRRLVTEAFTVLGDCDVVLGPTSRGGYYLCGLREPQPALLRGLRWSGAAVLALTKARAAAAGLGLRLLRPLRSLDTLQDARLLGLLGGRSTIDGTST
jgi:hypothetical protein